MSSHRSKKPTGTELERAGILSGHAKTVIALAIQSELNPILASGSEDGTVRIWDLRQSPWRSCGYLEFGVPHDPATDLHFHPNNSHLLYTSVGSRLFSTDLRQLSDSILLRHHSNHTLIATAPDEINKFSF